MVLARFHSQSAPASLAAPHTLQLCRVWGAPARKNCCSPALQATTSDSDANNLESWCLQSRWKPTCKRAKNQTSAESCCHPVS